MPELTEKQLTTLDRVKNGVDVYSPALARALRELDREHPGLVTITEPRMYEGDGTDTVPYFGAVATSAGRAALSDGGTLPAVLFDGYAVYEALSKKARQRTTAENVSDVLDAVVRLMREGE